MAIIPLTDIIEIKDTKSKSGNVVSLEEISGEQSPMKAGERNLSAADFSQGEQRIQNRPSAMADLIQDPSTMQRLQEHPLGTILRTLAGGAELAEGVPASIGLDIQNRNFGKILPHLGEVLTGQRPAELGDILSNAGAPEGVSAIGGLLASVGAGGGGKAAGQIEQKVSAGIKKIAKYESELQQATKAKTALDTLRGTIGQAKTIAIKEVENAPTDLRWTTKSNKVLDAIKNPVYEVAFNKDGTLVQTVGNLDKIKTAVGELISSPKIWEEAPKTEIRDIKRFYGQINQVMKNAATKAGKPIDNALKNYDEFMDKYTLVNKTLVDNAGNAMGNKLKSTFKLAAEPAYKEAWKEVSKASPEIKEVMNSMKNRMLLGNLVKAGIGLGAVNEGVKFVKRQVR
jgi:hypothetical protein